MSVQHDFVENVPNPKREDDNAAKPAVEAETRLDIMKSWIKACNKDHGSPCVVPKSDASVWPALLIDTVDACIVEGIIADRYLTLSYVWGGVQTLQLTSSNIGHLRQQGSLAKEQVILPRTIRDALEITRFLEERYIFVDQLCIIQDDQQHKMAEIEHMTEIYANAYVTLVATTGGTANSGLADKIEQWVHQCPVTKVSDRDHSYTMREIAQSPNTRWATRGWTFQEHWAAGRLLHFLSVPEDHDGRVASSEQFDSEFVSWNCHQAWWHDIRGAVTNGSDKRWQISGPITWPDLSRYATNVQVYVRRYFTYDSDIVPAFAGIASAFAKTFPGGILYGLPVIFFDAALMWRFKDIPATRVMNTKPHERLRAPSWSWMSWRGDMDSSHWRCFTDLWEIRSADPSSDPYIGLIISPLVQWYYYGAGGVKVAIENGYHKYRYFARDSESAPPPGWSRITPSSTSLDMQHTYYYVTPMAPGRKFRFPIPLVTASHAAITIPRPISNVITCQTQRAYFYVAGQKTMRRPHRPISIPHRPFSICDGEGSLAGWIFKYDDAHELLRMNPAVKLKVELIAISTSFRGTEKECYERLFMGGHSTENRTDDVPKEWYNVLWIEWIDGIAYRKAVGVVRKGTWEAADREVIDVKLG